MWLATALGTCDVFLTKNRGASSSKTSLRVLFDSQLFGKKKHSNYGNYKRFGENAQQERNVVINRLRVLSKAPTGPISSRVNVS